MRTLYSFILYTISYTSQSTFIVNNTAIGYSCICLDYPESSQCIDTCNIINNEQSSTTGAMIRTSAQLYIKSSCIIGNNKGKLLLDEAFSECNIILTNSTFDNDVKTSSRYKGGFIIESTIKITIFYHKLWSIICSNAHTQTTND